MGGNTNSCSSELYKCLWRFQNNTNPPFRPENEEAGTVLISFFMKKVVFSMIPCYSLSSVCMYLYRKASGRRPILCLNAICLKCNFLIRRCLTDGASCIHVREALSVSGSALIAGNASCLVLAQYFNIFQKSHAMHQATNSD